MVVFTGIVSCRLMGNLLCTFLGRLVETQDIDVLHFPSLSAYKQPFKDPVFFVENQASNDDND